MSTKIERWARRFSGGDIVKEFHGRMNQFTGWKDLGKDEIRLEEDEQSLTITIDGTKEIFKQGDALDCVEDEEMLEYLRFALFLGARVTILPATEKTVSIQFYWEKERLGY